MAGKKDLEVPTLTFGWEYRGEGNSKKFNLYERGGDRYLCGHGQWEDPQPCASLGDRKLDLLYPVAVLENPHMSPEIDLHLAIKKIVGIEMWSFPAKFNFTARSLDYDIHFKGKASVSHDGRKGKLESISFHE